MSAWHDGPLVAFDLETTSPNPEEARIVTAALAVCGMGLETDTRTWLADPGIEIPDEAAAIHGITTEKAKADGLPAAEVVRDVVTQLAVALAYGPPLIIFNARYDLTVLDRECRRYGVPPLQERQFDLRVIDPLVIDKHLHRYRKGSRKLDAQATHYGATLDGAHDASFDALCAARVAWCIGKRGEVIRRVRGRDEAVEKARLTKEWETVRHDLDRLHAAQVRWAAAQAASLEDYFRQQGKPERVERDWPVIPYVPVPMPEAA